MPIYRVDRHASKAELLAGSADGMKQPDIGVFNIFF